MTRVKTEDDYSFLPARVSRAADQAVEEVLAEDLVRRALKRPLATS